MTDLLQGFLSGSAAWGVLLTLAAFALGTLLNKATGKAIFNPLLLGSIFVIILLSVLNIPYADYKVSAAPVNYLLLPATISLAIPLYEKWDLLKENAAAIIAGISVGTLVSLGSADGCHRHPHRHRGQPAGRGGLQALPHHRPHRKGRRHRHLGPCRRHQQSSADG